MTDERYRQLIKALTDADITPSHPLVQFEELITREDAFFAHAIHVRLDSPEEDGA
jgi:hypothetical protein